MSNQQDIPVILYCGRTNKCGIQGNIIAKNIRQFTRGLQLDGRRPAFAIVDFESKVPTNVEVEWANNDVRNCVEHNGFVFVVGRPDENTGNANEWD